MKNVKGFVLVLIPFTGIAWFVFYNGPIALHLFWQIVEGLALLLGAISIAVVGWRNLSIFPVPKTGSSLVTAGPYRYIRHPMYTAVIFFCLSLVSNRFSLLNFAILWVLIIDLLIKIHYEESLLVKSFPGYQQYRSQTKRLLPFLY
ncbi:MAG: hypothetical protein GC171_02040 [Terrimonas sp.]|nr:hypothetical protein [Terrimonas sp.]